MWDFLAYFSVLVAVVYAGFILWFVLRGWFDQDDHKE